MQCADGLGQAHVGQTGHDTTVHQLVRHGVAKQLDHQHLGQAVHHRPVSAAAGMGLAEQKLLGEIEAGQLGQRHAQQCRQPAQQRVLVTDSEIDRRAHDIGTLALATVESVRTGPREEQHAGLADDAVPPQRVRYAQRPAPHQVQMADAGSAVEVGNAAQRPAVEHACVQLEALEQG